MNKIIQKFKKDIYLIDIYRSLFPNKNQSIIFFKI